MKNIYIFTLLALTFMLSGCHKKPQTPPSNQKPIVKIGVICPLTGNLAFYGEDLRDGILFAKKEFSSNTKFNYQIIFEDDQFDNKKTILAAQKLINVDKVDCLVTMFSNAGLLINPIAEKDKIIHFGVAYNPKVADGFYNFNHWPHISKQVEIVTQHLSTLPYKKVGIIVMNEQGELAAREEFKRQLPSTGKELVFDETFNPGERDFRTLLTKAKDSQAEIFFVVILLPEIDIMVKQMREMGMNQIVFSLNDFKLLKNLAPFENSFYADRGDPTEFFAKRFESNYHHSPGLLVPHGFDIFDLIAAAYEKSPSQNQIPSHEEIVNRILASPTYDGAFGKTEIDSNGIISSPLILKQIKNGQRAILKNP